MPLCHSSAPRDCAGIYQGPIQIQVHRSEIDPDLLSQSRIEISAKGDDIG